MSEWVLCSNCFRDEGLRLDAQRIGEEDGALCRQCKTEAGRKLDKERVEQLAHRFFVWGTITRVEYGGAPLVQFNEHHYGKSDIEVSEWLQQDLKLIEDAARIGFFPYGPRLWMVGEVEPLKALENPATRRSVIERILADYPERELKVGEAVYRLRKKPEPPDQPSQYDSPPADALGKYRLDSPDLPVWYGSQDLEVCIQECRVTIEDDLFVATAKPVEDLKLLDLTEVIREECTEFESLDMAIHMLFLAGKHSYEISRDIARAVREAGFDGLVYPSYFSLVRTGTIPFQTAWGLSLRRFPQYAERAKAETIQNIALFGRPIAERKIAVQCINRMVLTRVIYDGHFGPVKH